MRRGHERRELLADDRRAHDFRVGDQCTNAQPLVGHLDAAHVVRARDVHDNLGRMAGRRKLQIREKIRAAGEDLDLGAVFGEQGHCVARIFGGEELECSHSF